MISSLTQQIVYNFWVILGSKAGNFTSAFCRGPNNYPGLLVTRAYSLCHRNKGITAALAFGLLIGLVLNLLGKEVLIFSAIEQEILLFSRDNAIW